MSFFLFKLNPPRPSFPSDITPEEARLMQEHVAYWTSVMEQGHLIAFGPVADPKGTYGIGILQIEDGIDPESFCERDPVVAAKVGFTVEIHPMPRAVIRE